MTEPFKTKRLDLLLTSRDVDIGTRFLYTAGGTGVCREGTLRAFSSTGHYVKLDESGTWHFPATLFVIEIWPDVPLSPAAVNGERESVAASLRAPPPPTIPVPTTATTTTKPTPKRRTV